MGLLGTLETLPYLLLGLFAGALVDRWPRRPILITADLVRALLLAIVPIAFLLGALRLEVVFAVGLLVGIFNVFFVVGYGAFVPSVVAATNLVEGNSRLALSQQVARVVGPGLAGALVQDVKGLAGTTAWPVDNVALGGEASPRHFIVFVCFVGQISNPQVLPEVWIVPSTKLEPLVYHAPGGRRVVSYWLEQISRHPLLVASSWCRVVDGSGQCHVVSPHGYVLIAEGFV